MVLIHAVSPAPQNASDHTGTTAKTESPYMPEKDMGEGGVVKKRQPFMAYNMTYSGPWE